MHHRWISPCAALLTSLAGAQPSVEFGRDVRPLLSDRCFTCHGPDADARKGGLRLDNAAGSREVLPSGARAVVPGQALASELLRRVTHPEASERMPPLASGQPLTEAQVATLQRWIDSGAEYTPHWSLVPPVRPELPSVGDPAWPRQPIDRFVLARLEHEGLRPAGEAERAALLRRVTYDLTGLPPTLAELDAFVADPASDAYERAVERLLASPRYGEHMARYWLDAARYGDTHGLHLDNFRSMWPWRDWVIEAFNANMPFDQFTIRQLAGDLLPDATLGDRVATGFHRCNVTTAEGGLIEEEYVVKYAVDRVETTGTVWLGMTIGCAQCHDHKFDPITQRDFYDLLAFFHSVAESGDDKNVAVPPPRLRAPDAAQAREQARLARELATATAMLDLPVPELDAAQAAFEEAARAAAAARVQVLEPLSALSRGGATLRVLADQSVEASGVLPSHDSYEIVARTEASGILALRLEALGVLDKVGSPPGRAEHGNFVLSEIEVEAAPATQPLLAAPVALAAASADYSQAGFDIARVLDDAPTTGWAVDGRPEDRTVWLRLQKPLGFAGGTLLRVRLRFESQFTQHTIHRVRLAVSTDPTVLPIDRSPWRIAGPYPMGQGAAFATAFAPETEAEVAWRDRADLTPERVHPLPNEVGATYLDTTWQSPNARTVTMGFGSDDGLVVWLNGVKVLSRQVRRAASVDQDQVELRLQPGANRLLVKVVNEAGGSGFAWRVIGEESEPWPAAVGRALRQPLERRAPAQRDALRRWFRADRSEVHRELSAVFERLTAALAGLEAKVPETLVMAELGQPRDTHLLIRGRYDQKGPPVTPAVPAVFAPLPGNGRGTRLDLARWLVDGKHPLTARVTVNRLWQQLFGIGLVKTAEDFGCQGEWPLHRELLDWLATELVGAGWDVKHVLRAIVTSATYRQASAVSPELLQRDRDNRLLARGPRFRLDAEAIRDTALVISGLLVEQLGGPSVKPYQPEGVWEAVAYPSSNTARFTRDVGDGLHRRSLYTFWKRTAPPPGMALLDAPSRESCTVRRARTNTPLQALALWNDEQYVEAARVWAARLLGAEASSEQRLIAAFRAATSRPPSASELATLLDLLAAQRAEYRADPAAAAALLAVGEHPASAGPDPIELAAWTVVASTLLNLDETLTKG